MSPQAAELVRNFMAIPTEQQQMLLYLANDLAAKARVEKPRLRLVVLSKCDRLPRENFAGISDGMFTADRQQNPLLS
jgi:hypothetical protein